MSEIAIKAEALGKRYKIGERRRYKALRDSLEGFVRQPLRHLQSLFVRPRSASFVWVLDGVSFEIKRGEVVGIIGRNGAGKSTLLKILSRITWPTTGYAEIHGRVGSLLEVGTGFHPELTGRENVYLNGAIIGMKRREISSKFDEIVSFAEIDKFLDTQVKFYSSGMYMRLAFSVAAHLEPEILLVDEVLAVGDASFQKKCLGKMGEVAREGRTVLFVSHSLGMVNQLCERAFWLDGGRLVLDGQPENVVSQYVASGQQVAGHVEWPAGASYPGVRLLKVTGLRVRNSESEVTSKLEASKPFTIEISFSLDARVAEPCRVGLIARTVHGVTVFEAYDSDEPRCREPRAAGSHLSICEIPSDLLHEGRYFLSINADLPNVLQLAYLEDVLAVDVEDTRGEFAGAPRRGGVVRPALKWSTIDV